MRRAYSLVELLVVIGIVAALVALLLPAVGRAWDEARSATCKSNLHELSLAMATYAAGNGGRYPPNTSATLPPVAWYDDERVGGIVKASRPPVPAGKPGGGCYACPNDTVGNVLLSYAMDVWASARLDDSVVQAQSPASARQWSARVPYASNMILLAEAYPSVGTAAGWYAPPTVGQAYATAGAPSFTIAPTYAGQRFGGGSGVLYTAGRFGKTLSELCFSRHRIGGPALGYTVPRGRLNLAYADGHVESKSDRDLVGPDGRSTGDSCWSPADLGRP